MPLCCFNAYTGYNDRIDWHSLEELSNMGTEDIAGEEEDECREEDHRVAREDQQVAGQIVLGAIHTGRILKELKRVLLSFTERNLPNRR